MLRKRPRVGEEVEDTGLVLHRRPSWPRRIRAVLGTGFLAVVSGMALATIIGIGVAAAVITITGLLKQ